MATQLHLMQQAPATTHGTSLQPVAFRAVTIRVVPEEDREADIREAEEETRSRSDRSKKLLRAGRTEKTRNLQKSIPRLQPMMAGTARQRKTAATIGTAAQRHQLLLQKSKLPMATTIGAA